MTTDNEGMIYSRPQRDRKNKHTSLIGNQKSGTVMQQCAVKIKPPAAHTFTPKPEWLLILGDGVATEIGLT
jgi:hypothetical protein